MASTSAESMPPPEPKYADHTRFEIELEVSKHHVMYLKKILMI
jgi:hypothetical protein